MAKPFDPRKVLKHIANPLLREFFTRRGELDDVPWDELTEHKIEPVFEAWQALGEASQKQVQIILRDINELADHRGLAVLAEEILWRCPDRADEYKAQSSKADKAMWVCLYVPEAFEEAAIFARADALKGGRHWGKRNGLPKGVAVSGDGVTDRLATTLTQFYSTAQLRGRFCKVVPYSRGHMVFDDAGRSSMQSERYAFENVFVYNSDEGTMESYVTGGRRVREPLEVAFCRAVLGEDVGPGDPLRPSFRLDHLLTPDFPLPTDPNDGVEEARITRLRISPRGSGGYIEIKANLKGHPNDIYSKIERWLKAESIPAASTRVLQTTFRLAFHHDGPGRQPTLTFDVSAPNSSNLKSKPDEKREVGERCLKLWEVVVDDDE